MADITPGMDGLIGASKQISQQIGALNKTLSSTFPQTSGVAGAAGAPTGTYLSIVGPDGNPYKLALLAP